MPRPRRAPNSIEPLVGVAPLVNRWIERLLAVHEPRLTLAQFLAMRAIAADSVTATELARRRRGSPRPEVDRLGRVLGRLEEALGGRPPPRRPPPPPPRRR